VPGGKKVIGWSKSERANEMKANVVPVSTRDFGWADLPYSFNLEQDEREKQM
jgi:hypothetical protein